MSLDSAYAEAEAADTIVADSAAMALKSENEISSEVDYNAVDSLIFSLDGGTVELFGNAIITFDDIELTAAYIRYEMDQNIVVAYGVPDSMDVLIGKPVFTDPSGSFESKQLRYNFKTKKGYIEEVVTEQEGG